MCFVFYTFLRGCCWFVWVTALQYYFWVRESTSHIHTSQSFTYRRQVSLGIMCIRHADVTRVMPTSCLRRAYVTGTMCIRHADVTHVLPTSCLCRAYVTCTSKVHLTFKSTKYIGSYQEIPCVNLARHVSHLDVLQGLV